MKLLGWTLYVAGVVVFMSLLYRSAHRADRREDALHAANED